MNPTILYIIIGLVALIVGIVLGKILFHKNTEEKLRETEQKIAEADRKAGDANKKIADAEEKAQKLIDDARRNNETFKEKKKQEAKEHFQQLKGEHEKTVTERNRQAQEVEARVKQLEQSFKQQQQAITDQSNNLQKQIKDNDLLKEKLIADLEIVKEKETELQKHQEEHLRKLEKVANLTAEEAKTQIIESIQEEARTNAMAHVKEIMEEAQANANKEAKKIIIKSIQRVAAETTIENAITVFNLESDEIKGQIIGREGRNIRALEAATGVDLVIDDTPEAIVLSCYDPLRREIARLSLQRLVQDGRIHPARIEEVVEKTRKALEEQIMEIGERTIIELGIHGLHKDLVRIVGKMRFRSSYGQNLLMHSKETANLCAVMAAELGLGQKVVKLAKRAGLLHDIGKVPDEQTELSHALLGAQLAEKYNEHAAVVNAIGAHHDEMEMQYIISPIIQACDAISGARPGARREMMQSYMQRIKDLENLAMNYAGVEKAYAIQAGRELRVMVEAGRVNDADSDKLSFDIADKIQKEMQYPGQIKVTVIRELRSVNVAR